MNKVLNVLELTNYIDRLISEDVILSNLRVRGEVSNFKHHTSGHMYFSLKDNNSKVKCVMFKSYSSKLGLNLEDGMEVILEGNIAVYKREGQYQMYVKSVEIAGIGELFDEYNKLKNRLEKEGFFDPIYKKKIPEYPRRIGILTSSTGAALQDMLNVINRRYPIAEIFIYSSLVQGKNASEDIIRGLIILDNYNLDTIILGRGGGSFEDLFAFNDEDLAKVIFAMKTPIITGIGHETDYTIADFVSDKRAATPSSAAELATPNILDMSSMLRERYLKIISLTRQRIEKEKHDHLVLENELKYYNVSSRIMEGYQDLDLKINDIAKNNKFKDERMMLNLLREKINGLDPNLILNRGYSILLEDDVIIGSKEDIEENKEYRLKLKDGEIVFKFNILKK